MVDVGIIEVRTAVVDACFEIFQDVWVVEYLSVVVVEAVDVAGGADKNTSVGWRELECVGKEVGEHLLEMDRVEPHLYALFFGLGGEGDVLGSGKS